ncbi:hypothetical protein Tco_1459317 [Tanacetum coccineum]
MYLTAFRHDIMFAVCACARFQVTPKTSHLYAVKMIFRYIKGQPKLGLWYPRDSPFNLEAFSDSDYARASLDRKSTTGGSGLRCQDTILGGTKAQIRFEAASKQSNNPSLSRVNTRRSGEDIMKLKELMKLYTILSERILDIKTDRVNKKSRRKQRKDSGPTELVSDEAPKVIDLEKAKTAQAKEIASLKKRVKKLEKRRKLRTSGLKRLKKIGSTNMVESSIDVSLGDQEDASKQGRKIEDLDADAEVTLVDETQEMNDDNLMFDTGVLEEQEKEVAKKEVSVADPVTTAGEVLTTANVEAITTNAPTITIDELTLAQTLIEIKAAKPKAVTSTATTTTTTRPKARGVIVQEPRHKSQNPSKAIMDELNERPIEEKDQVALNEEMASRILKLHLQAELIEEERLARQKENKKPSSFD